MRTEKEIRDVINKLNANKGLFESYKDDVILVLEWVLGGIEFEGIRND